MSVLTESDVKKMLSQGELIEKGDFLVEKGTIVTPAARTFLTDKNISLKIQEKMEGKEHLSLKKETEDKEVYHTLFGAKLYEKPEFMTHLRGSVLVFKDHPRILFRGAIDSLESQIILAQIETEKQGFSKITGDLEEIIRFIRKLLRCEVSGEPLGNFQLQALTAEELREYSHHPSKYLGMSHFLPSYKQGEITAILNQLRTKTRETELIAYQAFKDEYGQVSREDIIQGLNRLSSLFWVMMFKFLTDKYK